MLRILVALAGCMFLTESAMARIDAFSPVLRPAIISQVNCERRGQSSVSLVRADGRVAVVAMDNDVCEAFVAEFGALLVRRRIKADVGFVKVNTFFGKRNFILAIQNVER